MVSDIAKKAIYENAHTSINQDEWIKRNNDYQERYNKATERVLELGKLKQEKQNKNLVIETFIQNLEFHKDMLNEFDESLWMVTIEKVTIM